MKADQALHEELARIVEAVEIQTPAAFTLGGRPSSGIALPVIGDELLLLALKKASAVSPIFTSMVCCTGAKVQGREPSTLPSKRILMVRSSTSPGALSARWGTPP